MSARPNRTPGGARVSAARRRGGSGTIAGVAVVLVVAAAIVIGLVVHAHRTDTAAQATIPVVHSGDAAAPVSVDPQAAVVTVGAPGAPVTLDVYEDFLCPVCGQFEQVYGDQVRQAVTAGVVDLLDDRSDPPGYSLAAASAALAVAETDPGAFTSFHDSLYGTQPTEGGRGYDASQLDALATALGVPKGRVADALSAHTYDAAVQASLQKAAVDPTLQQNTSAGSGFGTPTVVYDGRLLDITNPDWLSALLPRH